MTHQIIFVSPRNPKVVENWPEEPNPMFNSIKNAFEIYQKACEQAISNAIEFKLEQDKEDIIWALWNEDAASYTEAVIDWQPEINKPYPVPDGIQIEIREVLESPDQNKSLLDRNEFAFIKSSQAVKTEFTPIEKLQNLLAIIHADGGHYTQKHGLDKAIEDACNIYYELRQFKEQVVNGPEPESQEALWKEVADYLYRSSNNFNTP